MSDCANGGRNVYQPVCRIEIKFEGHDVVGITALALLMAGRDDR